MRVRLCWTGHLYIFCGEVKIQIVRPNPTVKRKLENEKFGT